MYGRISHEADTHEQLNKKFIELAKEREALLNNLPAGEASIQSVYASHIRLYKTVVP